MLLDTHVWLWRLLEPRRLPARMRRVLGDHETRVYLSPISVWEVLVLAREGRLRLEPDPGVWVRTALRRSRPAMEPITHEIAIRSEELPGFEPQDPADRILVATALVAGLRLATADRAMRAYEPLATV